MTKVGIYWDEWYTWWVTKSADEGWVEHRIEVPEHLVEEYFAAINRLHDVKAEIDKYRP